VLDISISTWNYKEQADSIRHMGPMAQDFYAAFGLGLGETTIDTIDPDGVALAAIQGLHALVEEKDAEIASNMAQITDGLKKIPWPYDDNSDPQALDGDATRTTRVGRSDDGLWVSANKPGHYRIRIPDIAGYKRHDPIEVDLVEGKRPAVLVQMTLVH
jgi:hypothetical protein